MMGKSLVCWLAYALPLCSFRVALHNQITLLYLQCVSLSCNIVRTAVAELVSLLIGGIGTDTGCCDGCTLDGWKYQCNVKEHTQ